MYTTRCRLSGFLHILLLSTGLLLSAYATADTDQGIADELKAKQAELLDAQAAKEAAVKARDALAAQQASKPSPDTERKLKDAETDVMLADSKLNSAKKSVERVQKKLDESAGAAKATAQAAAPKANEEQAKKEAEAKEAAQKASAELAKKEAEAKAAAQKASEEQARKEAEAKTAALKANEEQARKEAEAKAAAQKASEELAKKEAEEKEAAAKKAALAAEMGIDKNCIALPNAPTRPASELSAADLQAQAYAQGFLKQINQLVSKKAADDAPPISPFPVLEGSKLNPCDPDQKSALKFGYMGNGQYRAETRVLAGEQTFFVKNVGQPLNRTIPEADNGEIYVFFLDGRDGRAQLMAYKKSLFEQAPQQ